MRVPLLQLTFLTLGLVLPAADLCGQDDPTSRRWRRGGRRQAPSQDVLIARKQAALNKPFLQGVRWITDFSTAKAEAKRTTKPIFAYFSRSYSP